MQPLFTLFVLSSAIDMELTGSHTSFSLLALHVLQMNPTNPQHTVQSAKYLKIHKTYLEVSHIFTGKGQIIH